MLQSSYNNSQMDIELWFITLNFSGLVNNDRDNCLKGERKGIRIPPSTTTEPKV